MNFQQATGLLNPENEFMATRGCCLRIARDINTGEVFRLSHKPQLYMTRILQPWVDTGQSWEPSEEDLAADDWVVTTLPSP